jgi:hypothetical protein
MEQQLESIEFPRMVVNVRVVGHNSLLGALALRFIENGYINHIGCLKPTEIVFVIKRVLEEVNLYDEINKVRDLMKIDENKITVFVE